MDWFSFLFGALVFGTWPFWFFLIALCSALMYEVENEKSLAATVTLVLGVIALYIASDINFGWIFQNVYRTLGVILGYFVIGAVWGVFKWYQFTGKLREKYDEERKRFLSQHAVTGNTIPDKLRDKWISVANGDYVPNYNSGRTGALLPDYKLHKEKITLWMTYWPWSFLWFAINDPVTRTFRGITALMHSIIVRIGNWNFSGTEDDLVPSPPPAPDASDEKISQRDPDDDWRESRVRKAR